MPRSPLSSPFEPARAVPALGSLLLLAAVSLGAAACSSGEDPKAEKARKEGREALEALEELARDRAQRFFEAMRDDFSDLDQKLDELGEGARELSGAAREQAQDLLEQAQAQREILARKLGEMKEAAGEDVARLQEELKVAYEAAELAIREARQARETENGNR